MLEPFIEGSLASFVEEKRNSSAVADILGAEQISRAGDSDAAGALKRVTGLTLVDGKFVYVRGLGERYSSVVVNGAQVRVVINWRGLVAATDPGTANTTCGTWTTADQPYRQQVVINSVLSAL